MQFFRNALIWLLKRGEPNVVISAGYLNRWYVIPRNKWFNIYLHEFIGSDDDRALHDHPWSSISYILRGEYKEYISPSTEYNYSPQRYSRVLRAGKLVFRKASLMHRIELLPHHDKPVYTLFVTFKRVRNWGFDCPEKGWIPHEEFCSFNENGVMRGCE